MPTSEDLHRLVSEFADLVRLEEVAQHELRSLRMRRGMKRKKLVKVAGLLLVSDVALAEMVAAASEPPPAPEPEPEHDGLCDECDGTGFVTDELGRGFCEACAGSGEAA